MSRNGGGSCRTAPVGERAARREAAALRLAVGAGHRALDGGQPLALLVEARDRTEKTDRIGVLGIGKQGADRALSTILPAYITSTSSAISAITPRSWVMIRIAMPRRLLQVLQQVEDLRLDGDIQRRRRLVGDQERRLADSAMAIMTRCRMPPDILWG